MSIIENDNKYIVSTYGRQNVVFVAGHDSTLIDDKGKEYIDFGCGIAVNGLGIAYEPWKNAVIEQINKIPHTSNLYYSEPQTVLAEKLAKRTNMKKFFFCNSGAEANECAIKCARKYSFDKYGKGRDEIVTLQNSFHGRTMATLSATGQDVFHNYFFPFLDGFKFATANKIGSFIASLTEKTCAVILELVQGEGGVVPLDLTFVKQVSEICLERDILLIIDEVQTGNGRTGSLYAYMQYGLKPDIVTTAKGLANGLPFGVAMFGDKTKDVLTKGTHGSTFGGNLVACAGAIAVLDNLNDELFVSVLKKSEKIKKALLKCPKVKSVTGLGFMLGVETADAKSVMDECLEKGLVVLTAKNKIRLLPPLNISDEDLNKGLKILTGVLS